MSQHPSSNATTRPAGTPDSDATPGYNHRIPEKITTPDEVATSIGPLKFFDGMPDDETVEKLYDHLLRIRGVETFLNGIPATSIEGLREGHVELGIDASNQFLIFDKLADSSPLFLTANTDTVYCSAFLDLERDGPTVVEVPPGCGPGTVNDAYFRFVVDMGVPGPDRGSGGKYLILPPDQREEMDAPIGGKLTEIAGESYFVTRSPSYVNWVILRAFPENEILCPEVGAVVNWMMVGDSAGSHHPASRRLRDAPPT